MKKLRFTKIRIPVLPVILFLVLITATYGMGIWIKNMQTAKQNHQVFRGNIENLYYYLKKEPKNFEMYAVLNQGDSVALSVWHNYLSTSDDIVKKYEKQLTDMAKGILIEEKDGAKKETVYPSSHYKEYVLLDPMKKALDLFKEIRFLNEARIEMKKDFSEKTYQDKKKELVEMLAKMVEEAKKVNLDLR